MRGATTSLLLAAGLAIAVAQPGDARTDGTKPTPAPARPEGGLEDDSPSVLFSGETSVSWVLVPITVRDVRGGYITDLERRHFRLRVDGRPLVFDSFDAEAAAPISLIQLQDLSGSMAIGGKLEAARAALDCFLEALRPADEIAVASFGAGQLGVDVPFTPERQPPYEAARTWQGYGSTALHDAVAWLPEISLDGRHARRAAVLLTDGADNASTLAADAARDMVRRARLPVYVIALDAKEDRKRRSQRRRAAQAEFPATSNRAMLEALSEATGGRFFPVEASADAAREACRVITTELRHQYVLGFEVASDQPKTDHRLEVEIAHARTLVITHRASYRGGSP